MAGRKWVPTIKLLAEELEVAPRTMSRWVKRAGFPAKTKRGFNVEKVAQFMLEARAVAATKAKEAGNAPSPYRDRKLLADCEIKEAKLALLRGKATPNDEVLEIFSEYADIANSVWDLFVKDVSATTRNAQLVKKAKALCARARKRFQDQLKKLEKRAGRKR